MYRLSSSQHSPQTMHTWERMPNLLFLKEYASLRAKIQVHQVLYFELLPRKFCDKKFPDDRKIQERHKNTSLTMQNLALYGTLYASIIRTIRTGILFE